MDGRWMKRGIYITAYKEKQDISVQLVLKLHSKSKYQRNSGRYFVGFGTTKRFSDGYVCFLSASFISSPISVHYPVLIGGPV